MRKLSLLTAILLTCVALAPAVKPLPIKKINVEKLTTETQKSVEPNPDGMNLVWWMPVEFWKASFAQDASVPAAQAKQFTDALEKYVLLPVVRTDITDWGQFNFHNRARTIQSLKVYWVDENGQKTALSLARNPDPKVKALLGFIRPMLSDAMGKLGENFHFLLFDNVGKNGQPIVDAKQRGQLVVEMAKLGTDLGGKVTIACPLDSLFVPRICGPCNKPMHSTWQYCPWCGKKLPK